MGKQNGDSGVEDLLKSLCHSNGWSYAVLWCYDHRDSSMLTMRNYYNEEQMGILIDNMLLKVHVLGTGIVGQTVSSMKNRWMFLDDDDCIGQNSIVFNNGDVAQNDLSDIHCQISLGIKTIALIPLEIQGVVQFGSTQKIYETQEFIFQTRRLLREEETTNVSAGFNLLFDGLDFGDNLGFLSNETMNFKFRETEHDLVSSPGIIISEKESRKNSKLRSVKKMAKPRTRPKPMDHVQIRKRISELRKLVPNSRKTSIDSLLVQTIKHTMFLERITKRS